MKYLPACEDGTERMFQNVGIQTPRNYPEESTQYSEHGESLKSRLLSLTFQKPKCILFTTKTTCWLAGRLDMVKKQHADLQED